MKKKIFSLTLAIIMIVNNFTLISEAFFYQRNGDTLNDGYYDWFVNNIDPANPFDGNGGFNFISDTFYVDAEPGNYGIYSFFKIVYGEVDASGNLADYVLHHFADFYTDNNITPPAGQGYESFSFDFTGYTVEYTDSPQSFTALYGDPKTTGTSKQFNGTFTGGVNGIVFDDIVFTDAGQENAGLFPVIGPQGVVKNVGILNFAADEAFNIGGIAGTNYGTIENCFTYNDLNSTNSDVIGPGNVGGIVGDNKGIVTNCFSVVNLYASNDGDYDPTVACGGIAGYNTGTITNCYSINNIYSSGKIGGIAGENDGGSVSKSYALSSVDYAVSKPYWFDGVARGDALNERADSGSTYYVDKYSYANGDVNSRLAYEDMRGATSLTNMSGLGSAFTATAQLPYITSLYNLGNFRTYVTLSVEETPNAYPVSVNEITVYQAIGDSQNPVTADLFEITNCDFYMYSGGALAFDTVPTYANDIISVNAYNNELGEQYFRIFTSSYNADYELFSELWDVTLVTVGFTIFDFKDAVVGHTYEVALEHNIPGENISWEISGDLPDGITLDDGVLNGTPFETGSYTFDISASSDELGDSLTQSFTLNVVEAVAATPEILTTSVPAGIINKYYETSIEASGSGLTFTLGVDSPEWISISESGILRGTPVAAGNYLVTVIAQNGDYNCARTYLLKITDEPVLSEITSIILPHGVNGEKYSYALSTLGTAPINFKLQSGKLPDGLSLSSDGVISGTPTGFDSYPFTIRTTNAAGFTDTVLNITIKLKGMPVEIALQKENTTIPSGAISRFYLYQIPVTAFSSVEFSITAGSLPSGLQMDKNGIISGVPKATTAGDYMFTLAAKDEKGNIDTRNINFKIVEAIIPPSITTTSLISATTQREYVEVIQANGIAPFYFEIISGTLPSGIEMSSRGEFSGIPENPETGTFTVKVSSEHTAETDTKTFSIVVTEWKSELDYNLVEPHDGTIDTDNDLTLEINGEFNKFRGLFLNGDKLEYLSEFNGREGSTVVTILSKTLKTKSSDKNDISAVFDDGVYEQVFTEKSDNNNNNNNQNLINQGNNSSTSLDNKVLAAIRSGKTEITLKKGDPTTLSKDTLQAIKKSGKDVTFILPSGLSIKIIAKSITDKAIPVDIDVKPELYTKSGSYSSGADIPAGSLLLNPPTKGEYGFSMDIFIPEDQIKAIGKSIDSLKVFYLASNGSTKEHTNFKAQSDGSFMVEISSSSAYLITDIFSLALDGPKLEI